MAGSRRRGVIAFGVAAAATISGLVALVADWGGALGIASDVYKDHLKSHPGLGWSLALAFACALAVVLSLAPWIGRQMIVSGHAFQADVQTFGRVMQWLPNDGNSIVWLRVGRPYSSVYDSDQIDELMAVWFRRGDEALKFHDKKLDKLFVVLHERIDEFISFRQAESEFLAQDSETGVMRYRFAQVAPGMNFDKEFKRREDGLAKRADALVAAYDAFREYGMLRGFDASLSSAGSGNHASKS